ncbi:MAG TPA: RluA family pseudouridine synthase [Candidatus Portnoybacteria bacterium]|nr:RluA family pseudouridine synthase [Candidatus Portnoybacteria bacterium]
MRLDKYLTNKYPNLSRVYIKNQVNLGNFVVYPESSRGIGNKKVKPSYLLREGDKVAFAPGFALPDASQILPNPEIKLNIIYEDNNVLVINKPAGLSVHPRQDKNGLPLAQEIGSTLVSGLLAYYPAIASVGDVPSLRPGLVHRLDKDTSGVMIIAKNQISFDWLKKQFKERQTAKKYLALVHGKLKEKQGEIKTLLARASQNPTKQKVSREGKEAITQYKVIKEFQDYSLIEACPKTGRLHQIRVHLAHLGHPVAGDAKYGDKRLPTLPGLTRQFLHAKSLEITLPNNQKKTFQAPLPEELLAVLAPLEKI